MTAPDYRAAEARFTRTLERALREFGYSSYREAQRLRNRKPCPETERARFLFNIGSPGQKVTNRNPVHDGVKGSEGYERSHPNAFGWKVPNTGSKSSARKAASARIAKIPFPLANHIARVYHP